MTSVFGTFRSGPTYSSATRAEMFDAAMAQPMSKTATFFDQAKGGVLESYGLGTTIKDFIIPEGPTTPGSIAQSALRLVNPVTATIESARIAVQAFRPDSKSLDKASYDTSPYFRTNIPWDEGMTEDRAASLAMMEDAKQVRQFYAEKRPITSFIGNLSGQAIDPINFLPVAGPLVKTAAAARFGKVAGTAIHSALDAAGNTALFAISTQDRRAAYGDDVSWQATVSQIATAALIGSAFGAVGGAMEVRTGSRARIDVEQRLSTLRTTQEARIALNEGIDAMVRGDDINLSPNSTDPMARVKQEVDGLSRAYDQSIADVKAAVPGNRFDPIVHITPEDIEGSFVARGGYKGKGDVEVRGAGYGLVKFALKHGELSSKPSSDAITKQDILDFPNVVREYEPVITEDGGVVRRNWVVSKPDGRTVVYGDRPIAERGGERGLVTVHVEKGRELSSLRSAGSPGEPSKGSTGDTDLASFARSPDRSMPDPEAEHNMPTAENIARSSAVDNSTARTDPIPEGRPQAETRIAKPDDYKAMADQYRVDPETGAFSEDADLAQIDAEGRLTAEDKITMADAMNAVEDGKAYGEALKAAVGCLI